MDFDQQEVSHKDAENQLEECWSSARIEFYEPADLTPDTLFERHPFCSGDKMPKNPQRVGYMRVSTSEQKTDRQALGLNESCDRLYMEKVSAVARSRPVFEEVLENLRHGDSLVVWDLDRAFRSTVDAILTAENLRHRGVNLRIVSMFVDTATPEGELFYTILAGFAQYERRIIARRTREGMEAARRRGAQIGRPRILDAETVREAYLSVSEDGYPCRYVAALLGVSRITLQRSFRRNGFGEGGIGKPSHSQERRNVHAT